MIRRKNGKYSLSLIGKIVYDAHLNIVKALSYYWKLKTIESIDTSSTGASLPKEELIQLINALIDNHYIKEFLIKESLLHTIDSQRLQNQHNKEETDPHYKSRPSV